MRAVPDQIRQWVPGALPDARHRRLRAQRLPHARCGASSRSTATTSRWPRCKELADAGAVDRKLVAEAISQVRDRRRRPAAHDGMSATLTKVEVPDIGDFDDVPVIEILVSVGDTVAVEDPLVTLESDKATMDVPAPLAGVVREISVSVGDRVSQGSVLMSVESADGGSSGSGDGDAGRRRARRAGRGRRSRPARRRRRPPSRSRRPRSRPRRPAQPEPAEAPARPAPAQPQPRRPRAPTAAARSTPARPRGGWPVSWASTCAR